MADETEDREGKGHEPEEREKSLPAQVSDDAGKPDVAQLRIPAGRLLELLKEEGEDHGLRVSLTKSSTWMGPLPPPDEFARYNEAVPDACHRILTQFEEEGAHRRKAALRGQIWAGSLAAAAIIAACIMAVSGYPWAAGATVGFVALAVGASSVLSLIGRR